jgi:DHA2 family multidrug resistance protein
MATMPVVGRAIGRLDHRLPLVVGILLSGFGLLVMAWLPRGNATLWLIVAGAILGAGAGCMFTPLSALAYVTLPATARTDAAGLYSLLRQIGCAAGVAITTGLLAHGMSRHLAPLPGGPSEIAAEPVREAALLAYCDEFGLLAAAMLAAAPLLLLFRVPRPARAPVGGKTADA